MSNLLSWRVTFGNERLGTHFEIIVRAVHANEAKEKARDIARKRGHVGRAGTVRLYRKDAA